MYTSSGHLTLDQADMRATFLDLRKRSKEIVKALEPQSTRHAILSGKAKGVIVPPRVRPEGDFRP